MIPSVLLLALVAGLFVPRTWQWMLGAVLLLGVAWGVVIALQPDAPLAIVLGAAVLGAVNAVVGLGVGLIVRRLAGRLRRGTVS